MKFCVGFTVFLSFLLFPVAYNNLLERTYNGLNKVLDFMYENSEDIIIDGLFGIVLTKANLQVLITDHTISQEDRKQINALEKKASNVINLTKPKILNLDRKYELMQLIFLNSSYWKAEKFGQKSLNLLCKYPKNKDFGSHNELKNFLNSVIFPQTLSDYCLNDLIEKKLQTAQLHNNCGCDILGMCKKLMITDKRTYPGYGVTHQLLYLMTGKRIGCIKNSDWYTRKSRSHCSYIFWEARQNYKFDFLYELDDLLLEQIALCGMEGYGEFLALPFIYHVLNLQKPEGCFGIESSNLTNMGNLNHVRKKRSLSKMKFNCNDHTSGLGASVLSLILRKLLEDKNLRIM